MIQKNDASRSMQQNADKAAYMLAWRDRYIKTLQERLAGREEENEMLSALLFCALFRLTAEQETGEREVLIPTSLVTELLGNWQSRVVSKGEEYAVRFFRRAPSEEPHEQEGDGK